MASPESVAKARTEENREHWREVADSDSIECGWATFVLALDEEIEFLRGKLQLIYSDANKFGSNWATTVAEDGLTHEGRIPLFSSAPEEKE